VKIAELLAKAPEVINLGLRDFAHDIEEQKARVVQLDWRPSRVEDGEMKRLLEKLL
jgi:hypothetical protein